MLDREFKELEGKTIKKAIRHDESIIVLFTDDSYTGIYNRAETDKGILELAFRNYDFKDKENEDNNPDKQLKELERELEQVKAAYEDRVSDIDHLEKNIQEAIQIFKDIRIHGSWGKWNQHGIGERVDAFIKGQEIVN